MGDISPPRHTYGMPRIAYLRPLFILAGPRGWIRNLQSEFYKDIASSLVRIAISQLETQANQWISSQVDSSKHAYSPSTNPRSQGLTFEERHHANLRNGAKYPHPPRRRSPRHRHYTRLPRPHPNCPPHFSWRRSAHLHRWDCSAPLDSPLSPRPTCPHPAKRKPSLQWRAPRLSPPVSPLAEIQGWGNDAG